MPLNNKIIKFRNYLLDNISYLSLYNIKLWFFYNHSFEKYYKSLNQCLHRVEKGDEFFHLLFALFFMLDNIYYYIFCST